MCRNRCRNRCRCSCDSLRLGLLRHLHSSVNKYHGLVFRHAYLGNSAVDVELLSAETVCKLAVRSVYPECIVAVADIQRNVNYLTVKLALEKEGLIFQLQLLI